MGQLITELTKSLRKRGFLLILFVIFVIGFIYRIIDLDSNLPGLYNDELYFLLSAYAQLHHINSLRVPGYTISNFIFYSINGYIPSIGLLHSTPFSARFPVALYGSIIIFPIYLLTMELLNNRYVAMMASFLWAISPSAVVTSRVGYGVEIFPLFLFLFFVLFWLKFLKYKRLRYFPLSLLFAIPIFFFTSLRIWGSIPIMGLVIYSILAPLRSKVIFKKKINTTLDFLVAFLLTITAIWVSLLYLPVFLSHFGYSNTLGGVQAHFLLVSKPFPQSLITLITRLGYALSPLKMFWFGEFDKIELYYGSPVFVPFMPVFLMPFLYSSIFLFPLFFRKQPKMREQLLCVGQGQKGYLWKTW